VQRQSLPNQVWYLVPRDYGHLLLPSARFSPPLPTLRPSLSTLPPTSSTIALSPSTKSPTSRLDALSELIDASRNTIRTTEDCDIDFEHLVWRVETDKRSTTHGGAIAPVSYHGLPRVAAFGALRLSRHFRSLRRGTVDTEQAI
jgi:hypothetical protein